VNKFPQLSTQTLFIKKWWISNLSATKVSKHFKNLFSETWKHFNIEKYVKEILNLFLVISSTYVQLFDELGLMWTMTNDICLRFRSKYCTNESLSLSLKFSCSSFSFRWTELFLMLVQNRSHIDSLERGP